MGKIKEKNYKTSDPEVDKNIMNILRGVLDEEVDYSEGLLTGRYGKNILEYLVNYLCIKDLEVNPNQTLLKIVSTQKNKDSDSFCDGAIGLFWYLNYLHKSEFIDCDIKNEFSYRLEMLEKAMEVVYGSQGFDFLYGGLGYTFLFLELDYKVEDVIEKSLNILESKMISVQDGFYWNSIFERVKINMGLAHGIPSIIRILTIMYEKSSRYKDRIFFLLEGSVKFMLSAKQDLKKFNSCFPYTYTNSKTSRLTWCYGDLTVSLAIWHAGKVADIVEWQREAENIAKNTCNRKSFKNDVFEDLCLCHGSAGVAHIYKRFYQFTGIDDFRVAYDYWIDVTLNNLEKVEVKEKLEGGILSGLSGVCLVLLNKIKEYDTSWDRCLLIS